MTEAEIMRKILENRGLVTDQQIEEFFHPIHPRDISAPFDTQPAIDLIFNHINHNSQIAIYGDYDVDGVCSTAILWEMLNAQYKNVFPHIPHRRDEGYGLTKQGVDHCLAQGAKLIIAVDSGIVAHVAIDYCRSQGCDIIIIDHHEPGNTLPSSNVLLHSTATCAAGLAWFLARDFSVAPSLELVALAVICDIVPLLGPNRSFAKFGLQDLNHTTRPGLAALLAEAGLKSDSRNNQVTINPYHVGFILGPRLNAMGRLEHALDSLRLLCTPNPTRAQHLAQTLGQTNRARQDLTESAISHALSSLSLSLSQLSNLIVVADPSYDQGVIGLVAAKLVEKYWRPAIAISVGPDFSKGSARSISGFHITDHLRQFQDLLTEVGGHAMAAGFTIETTKLPQFTSLVSAPDIPPELLVKKQRVDTQIPLSVISQDFYQRLSGFEPFGLGNPTPVFLSPNVPLSNFRRVGKSAQHLKFMAGSLEAIYFNAPEINVDTADITYSISEDTWNGNSKLQLVVKELSHPAGNSPVTPS